ncbi:MAG TPA: SgcJ/EcaC family oxidoreductase [Holophagaceae bacterium]|jgi:hypothetical protein|nr:SgcJ/EcaC family oxidoreductase [Holophagaceae bacterium]
MLRAIPMLLASALCGQTPAPPAAPSSGLMAIVQRQMDAYNAHDAKAYTACFTPDAQFVRHPGITALSGQDEIYKSFAKFFREHKDARLRVIYRSELGPTTVIEHQVTEGADKNALPGLVIYKIQNGLIAAAWIVPAE